MEVWASLDGSDAADGCATHGSVAMLWGGSGILGGLVMIALGILRVIHHEYSVAPWDEIEVTMRFPDGVGKR